MAYTPKVGGYNWRKTVTTTTHKLQQQRQLLTKVVEGDLSNAELYQLVSAIALLNASVADSLNELLEFRESEQG